MKKRNIKGLLSIICAFSLLLCGVGCSDRNSSETDGSKLQTTRTSGGSKTASTSESAVPEASDTQTLSTESIIAGETTVDSPVTEPPATEQSEQTKQPNETTKPTETKQPEETDRPSQPDKRVAFTFDDGPHYQLTYQFADKLKEYNATATFFVVGNRVTGKAGEAIRYAADRGCEIGIHGYTHEYNFAKCDAAIYQDEVSKTDQAIRSFVEGKVRLMRPPGGNLTKEQIAVSPYSIILWSVDSEDWKHKQHSTDEEQQANIQIIVDNVLSQVQDGDIVLMHEIYENSYQAFSIIIDELYKQGYEVVSVSELLGDRLQPGQKYNSGR